MRYALLLLLATQLGCAIRYTESQLARQHGFTEAERRPDAEMRQGQRCYAHQGQATYCFLLGLYTDKNYEIKR